MPLSAMVKNVTIKKHESISRKAPYGDSYEIGTKIYYEMEPFQIFKEIYERNKHVIWGKTHGLSLSNNLWRYQNLLKQKGKIKQMYKLLTIMSEGLQEFRLEYRAWILDHLLLAMTKVKLKDAADNMYVYAREHKGSKWTRGIRWGTLTVEETKVVAWANQQAVVKLRMFIRKLDYNENLIWDLRIGFDSIRTRTELQNLEGNKANESYFYSRDARGLGFLSHIFGLLKHSEIRLMEKWIIEKWF